MLQNIDEEDEGEDLEHLDSELDANMNGDDSDDSNYDPNQGKGGKHGKHGK